MAVDEWVSKNELRDTIIKAFDREILNGKTKKQALKIALCSCLPTTLNIRAYNKSFSKQLKIGVIKAHQQGILQERERIGNLVKSNYFKIRIINIVVDIAKSKDVLDLIEEITSPKTKEASP